MPKSENGNSDEYRAGWFRKDGKRTETNSPAFSDERRGERSYWGPEGQPETPPNGDVEKTHDGGGDYLREYFGAPFRSENEKYENPGLGRNYSPRDDAQEEERAQLGDRSDQSRRRRGNGGGSEGSGGKSRRVLEGSGGSVENG